MKRRYILIGSGVLAVLLFAGNFHLVTFTKDGARPSFAVIAKRGFHFSDSFVSLDEVIRRSNIRNENFIAEENFDHLVNRLIEKELIQRENQ